MKKTVFACLTFSIFLFSCKKDDEVTVPPAESPFMNTNTGTTWIYENTSNDGTTTTTDYDTSTVTGRDTTALSKVYKVIAHRDGSASYFNQTGTDYFELQENAAGTGVIDALYLKNAPVGTTWTINEQIDIGTGLTPFILTFNVLEKGTTKTVKGITYNNVITIKTTVSAPSVPVPIVSDIRSYYAPNFGLIQGDYNISIPLAGITIQNQTLLKSADLR